MAAGFDTSTSPVNCNVFFARSVGVITSSPVTPIFFCLLLTWPLKPTAPSVGLASGMAINWASAVCTDTCNSASCVALSNMALPETFTSDLPSRVTSN